MLVPAEKTWLALSCRYTKRPGHPASWAPNWPFAPSQNLRPEMAITPSVVESYGVKLSQLTSPAAVRSTWALLFLSCHAMSRVRVLRVDESTVTVIVPFDGIGWLMTTLLFEIDVPLMAVITEFAAPTPSALFAWPVSQKPKVPSELRTELA